jgi:hypothetical protein
MADEPELLAELVKANETLAEMHKYLKFTNGIQVAGITLIAITGLLTLVSLIGQ